jgi:hypothetical protein
MPIVCNDNNVCTDDGCNPATGCVHTPITCNDNNACTIDTCNPTTGCVYTPIICNDNNPSTIDTCNPETGCVYKSLQFIKIVRTTPAYYDTLQAAYDAAVDGDTIQSQAVNLTGSLNINRPIAVILEGGYDDAYATRTGVTGLKGALNISSGSAAIRNMVLQK